MKRLLPISLWGAMVVLLLAAPAVRAADYGTIRGKFILKGQASERKPIDLTKDKEFCSKMPPLDESIVVGENGGLAHVVIYAIGDIKDMNKPIAPIHPDYEKIKGQAVELDNKFCRFEPRVATLWTAQPLLVKNSDPMSHNAFGTMFNNRSFNLNIPGGSSISVKLENGEKAPAPVACTIHGWMKSYVVVRPDPYSAASGEDGSFVIENIPAGTHTFQLWHQIGYLRTITLGGKDLEDLGIRQRGQYTLEVKAGENDWGDIVLDAAKYADQIKKVR